MEREEAITTEKHNNNNGKESERESYMAARNSRQIIAILGLHAVVYAIS
jgi:hypothetical protein